MTQTPEILEQTEVRGRTKPILFSGPMCKAILEGRKTQTRRVLKPQPRSFPCFGCFGDTEAGSTCGVCGNTKVKLPYAVGDVLWVRETWCYTPINMRCTHHRIHYQADDSYRDLLGYDVYGTQPPGEDGLIHMGVGSEFSEFDRGYYGVWKPSIHMPRCAARIWLEATGVKVERVQEIGPEDAMLEGCDTSDGLSCVDNFAELWDSLNASRKGCSWADNPWVEAVTFKRIEKPEAAP